MARTLLNLPYWLADYGPRTRQKIMARTKRAHASAWQDNVREMDRRVALLDPNELVLAEEIPLAHRQVIAAHLQAMREYHPRAYGGHVTLFRVRALSLLRAADPAMGWRSLARGGVTTQLIPGAHYNILQRPHVESLARELRKHLE